MRLYDVENHLISQLKPDYAKAFVENLRRLGKEADIERFERTYELETGELTPAARSDARVALSEAITPTKKIQDNYVQYVASMWFRVRGAYKSLSCPWYKLTCPNPYYYGTYTRTNVDGTMAGQQDMWIRDIDFELSADPLGKDPPYLRLDVHKDYGNYLATYSGWAGLSGDFIPWDTGKITSVFFEAFNDNDPWYTLIEMRTSGSSRWLFPNQWGGDGVSKWNEGFDGIAIYITRSEGTIN